MNWQRFLKSGSIVQLSAERYWLGMGPFEWIDDAAGRRELSPKGLVSESARKWPVGDTLVAPDFYWSAEGSSELSLFRPSSSVVLSRGEILEFLEGFSGRQRTQWLPANPEKFRRSFETVKQLIQSGQIQKAVPITYEISQGVPSVGDMLKSAVEANSGQESVYGFWHEPLELENCKSPSEENSAWGIFGLTPEKLYQRQGKKLQSMALAGTKSVQDKSKKHLLEDRKELVEHELVRHFLKNSLAEWGSVHVSAPQVVRYRQLEHLRSEIEVNLDSNVDDRELMKSLHPTPALGCFPKENSFEVLKDLDDEAGLRDRFGAPFGVRLASGETHCLVAIRNVQWRGGKTYLFSGCGVVEQSQLESEWSELASKRQSVKDLLGLSNV